MPDDEQIIRKKSRFIALLCSRLDHVEAELSSLTDSVNSEIIYDMIHLKNKPQELSARLTASFCEFGFFRLMVLKERRELESLE